MGAGLGPATAFLYSGPAINVLAIVLTARILGPELGIARAVGAVVFAIVIGLIMQLIFRDEEESQVNMHMGEEEVKRPLWKNALYFASMVAILVFANWGAPEEKTGIWMAIYSAKWYLTSLAAVAFAMFLVLWFDVKWWKVAVAALPVAILAFVFPEQPLISFTAGAIALSVITSTSKDENGEWFYASWEFAKQIMPLLLFGVLVAGFLLGRVDAEGVIPSHWVSAAVGGNSLLSNFVVAFAGAFMYFATLTEVPIIQGLMNNGMGKGPALALLLSGPALSLPSILVIRSVMGNKKTAVFVGLVVVMSTISGVAFGALFP